MRNVIVVMMAMILTTAFSALASIRTSSADDKQLIYYYQLDGAATNLGSASDEGLLTTKGTPVFENNAMFGEKSLRSTGAYVLADTENGLADFNTGWTLSFWFKSNGLANWRDVCGFDIGNVNYKFEKTGLNTLQMYNLAGMPQLVSNDKAIQYEPNEWMNITIVSLGQNRFSIYARGRKVQDYPVEGYSGSEIWKDGIPALTKIFMGTQGLDDGRGSTALTSDYALYNYAVNEEQIAWLAQQAPIDFSAESAKEIRYDVPEGEVKTVEVVVTGDVPIYKVGLGTLIISSVNEGYTGRIHINEGALDIEHNRDLQNVEFAAGTKLVVREVIADDGHIHVTGIIGEPEVEIYTANGTMISGEEVTIESSNGVLDAYFTPTVAGRACWIAYEMNGSLENTGYEGTSLSRDSDNGYGVAHFYGDNLSDDFACNESGRPYALYAGSHPYRKLSTDYPENWTCMISCTLPQLDEAALVMFGAHYFPNSDGGTGLLGLITGSVEENTVLLVSTPNAKTHYEVLAEMKVPNAFTSRHMYLFVKEGRTVNIYVDGEFSSTYTFAEGNDVSLGRGMQIASVNGGVASTGIRRFTPGELPDRMNDPRAYACIVDSMRFYDCALGGMAIETLKREFSSDALFYDVFFSPEAGAMFTDSLTVALTPGKSGLAIRYTTDGSTPTLSSELYSGPFTITKSTTIKAATVNCGVLGLVCEASYVKSDPILGEALNAPQLVWTTSPDYPWVSQTDNTYDGFAAQSCQDFIDGAGCYKKSWLKTTVTGPTELCFRYQLTHAHGKFVVYCDDQALYTDSVSSVGIGRTKAWNSIPVSIPSGTHEIKFAFEQGGAYFGGFNGVVLDTVGFNSFSPAPTISPATTDNQYTATTFKGSMMVTIEPPDGRSGTIFYTLDGSDPTKAGATIYEGPFEITKSVFVQAIFVEPGKEPMSPAKGYFLARNPVKPGEWVTDVEGAKTAAAKDGNLIVVLFTDVNGCHWSREAAQIVESEDFLQWAAANGVYLIVSDKGRYVEWADAYDYCKALIGEAPIGTPLFAFALPSTPDVGSAAFPNGRPHTIQDMIEAFAGLWGASSVPSAPTITPDAEFVDAFPITVSLTNPDSEGTIYYTLDGSFPTKTNGTKYTGAFQISSPETTVKATVWGDDNVSSPVSTHQYLTYAYCLGTKEIVWINDSTCPWSFDRNLQQFRSYYKSDEKYTSTLKAVVSGKGKLSFKLECRSSSYANIVTLKRDGRRIILFQSTSFYSRTYNCEYELSSLGTTTFELSYDVTSPGINSSSHGCLIYDIVWEPETSATTTTPVSVPHVWIAEQFPSAITTNYETLMNDDSDGDGYMNWEEYLCGTDPNSGGTGESDAVPSCMIEIVNGIPKVEHNIEIPQAAKDAGWQAILKGSTDLKTWTKVEEGRASDYKFFKVSVEMK